MVACARRLPASGVLCGAIAVWAALVLGDASPAAAQGRAVGDIWSGQAPAPAWEGEEAAAGYALRSQRHQAFMQGSVPPEYRNAQSPYPATDKLIREGAAIYAARCADCHGPEGFGDGAAAMDLRPTPAFLAYMIESPDLVDQYLMWTIADGGAGFGSSMPAFKGTLTDREIWQVVIYMRAGFPDPQEPPQE